MSRVDVHPEDLLDAAHAGTLDAADRARLEQHVASCAACATELATIDDFAAELAPLADDDAFLDRLVAGAMGDDGLAAAMADAGASRAGGSGAGASRAGASRAGASRAGAASSGTAAGTSTGTSNTGRDSSQRSMVRRLVWAVAASLLLGLFGGAAAAMFAMWPQRSQEILRSEGATPTPASPSVAPRRARRVDPPISLPVEPEVVPPVAPSVDPVSAPEPVADRVARTPGPRAPSAEELLAAANQARREHDYGEAQRLYRRLQSVHPRSREAALSHVTLGRLLLDGMGDPAGALREFDRYLGQRGHRVLDEEARVGRALAFQRLGRRAEEQEAWRDLLAHHPDTLHAERARARLAL
jgi:hypothetical protein